MLSINIYILVCACVRACDPVGCRVSARGSQNTLTHGARRAHDTNFAMCTTRVCSARARAPRVAHYYLDKHYLYDYGCIWWCHIRAAHVHARLFRERARARRISFYANTNLRATATAAAAAVAAAAAAAAGRQRRRFSGGALFAAILANDRPHSRAPSVFIGHHIVACRSYYMAAPTRVRYVAHGRTHNAE